MLGNWLRNLVRGRRSARRRPARSRTSGALRRQLEVETLEARSLLSVTFGSALNSPSGGTGPAAAAVADFNRDGKLDLAVANRSGGSIGILLGNADGTFAAPTTL